MMLAKAISASLQDPTPTDPKEELRAKRMAALDKLNLGGK
jgi:hypothetical protein